MSDNKPKVIGRECKFVTYAESNQDWENDACIVKEIIHYDNGDMVPHIYYKENYQRPFYVTKLPFRQEHEQKKESESLKKLQMLKSNDRELIKKAALALNTGYKNKSLKMLARNPYLYGADVTSPVIIKQKYQSTFPNAVSENKVAVLDIETDVTDPKKPGVGEGDIISISVTCKSECFLAVNKSFVNGLENPEEEIQKAVNKYLEKHVKERKIDLKIEICDTPALCVVAAMNFGHKIKPDFMAIWNIGFDVPKMAETLITEGYDPAHVMADPCVPEKYRKYSFVEAPKIKVMASGRSLPVPFQERLHMVYTSSSWQWMDAMVLYALIRKAKGQLPFYKLDYILNLELGERKLNFEEANGLEGKKWHDYMQRNHKGAYMAYNIFDCIGIELLDEQTKDLALTINELIGISEMKNFTSTPTQLADDLHFVYLKDFEEVISSKSDRMEDDNDKLVINMTGHIITLATHLNAETGIKPYCDMERMQTLIRRYVVDLDVKSAYPYGQIIENISKSTTRREVVKIQGVSDIERRRLGLNLTAGRVNAVEYCTTVHKVPELRELEKLI